MTEWFEQSYFDDDDMGITQAKELRLPKSQWWLKLRPLLRILAQHDSVYEEEGIYMPIDLPTNTGALKEFLAEEDRLRKKRQSVVNFDSIKRLSAPDTQQKNSVS